MFNQDHPYFEQFSKLLQPFISKNPQAKIFIFGSAVTKEKFNDIDVAIQGKVLTTDFLSLQDNFEESDFPYIIDLRNLNEASTEFIEHINSLPKIWIQP